MDVSHHVDSFASTLSLFNYIILFFSFYFNIQIILVDYGFIRTVIVLY
jgi:hypothetical protein